MAASAIPICRSGRSPIPITASTAPASGVLLGAYLFEGANSYEFTAMPPAERVARAVEFGAQIHPQYKAEFENGVAVAWHRVPFTLGCSRRLDATTARAAALTTISARSTGASCWRASMLPYLPAWQEGAILSSLDAITRLHDRVVRT